MAEVGILMATFNGAPFLQAQLDSIAAQTHSDWHLWIRDDGSADLTSDLLALFALSHSDRVTVVNDDHGCLGPRGNFNQLIGLSREPYLTFADQDDVWHPEKIACALTRMKALEASRSKGSPCLVHADRRVIDGAGRELAASFWASRGLRSTYFGRLESHLAFCVAASAAMMINRPLVDLAWPISDAARMHDCWLELVAHSFGTVDWMPEVALDYRRHGRNASGAVRPIDGRLARTLPLRAWRLSRNLRLHRRVYKTYFEQAAAFQERFGRDLSPEVAQRLEHFLSIPHRHLVGRLHALRLSHAAPPGALRALVFAALSGGLMQRLPAEDTAWQGQGSADSKAA